MKGELRWPRFTLIPDPSPSMEKGARSLSLLGIPKGCYAKGQGEVGSASRLTDDFILAILAAFPQTSISWLSDHDHQQTAADPVSSLL